MLLLPDIFVPNGYNGDLSMAGFVSSVSNFMRWGYFQQDVDDWKSGDLKMIAFEVVLRYIFSVFVAVLTHSLLISIYYYFGILYVDESGQADLAPKSKLEAAEPRQQRPQEIEIQYDSFSE